MEEIQGPGTENVAKRPQLLTVLCILTVIGSGLNFMSSLVIALFYDQFIIVAESINKTFKLPGLEMLLEGKALFFGASSLIYAGCVAGALLMWNQRKTGFHVYTIFQILLILSPMYFFHLQSPSIYDLILSAVFVLLYSRNLKTMS